MTRIETRIHANQTDETANQQPGTRKQHQRKTHLQDYERASGHSAALSGGGTTASFFKRLGDTRMRRDKRRKEAKDQPGKQGGSSGEAQNAHVDRDGAEIEKIPRARGKQSVRAPNRQAHSDAPANDRQQDALC